MPSKTQCYNCVDFSNYMNFSIQQCFFAKIYNGVLLEGTKVWNNQWLFVASSPRRICYFTTVVNMYSCCMCWADHINCYPKS